MLTQKTKAQLSQQDGHLSPKWKDNPKLREKATPSRLFRVGPL